MFELKNPGGYLDQLRHCRKNRANPDGHDKLDGMGEPAPCTYNQSGEGAVDMYVSSGQVSLHPICVDLPEHNGSKHGWFGITNSMVDPFPKQYLEGFQSELGIECIGNSSQLYV